MTGREVVAGVIALLGAGCAITYGREFDTTKVSQIS